MKSQRYFSDSSTRNPIPEALVSMLHLLAMCYDETVFLIDMFEMTVQLYADRPEPRELRDAKTDHNRTMEQTDARFLRGCYDACRESYDSFAGWLVAAKRLRPSLDAMNIGVPYESYDDLDLAAWLVAAEGLRLSLDAMSGDVPYEPQNDMPYRKAAQDRVQSHQFTLTCSLHGTVLAFAAFHQAWEFTRHMYA